MKMFDNIYIYIYIGKTGNKYNSMKMYRNEKTVFWG